MTNILERARAKTPKERRVIAFTIAGIFVGVLFIVWVTVFINRVSVDDFVVLEAPETTSEEAAMAAVQEEPVVQAEAEEQESSSPLKEKLLQMAHVLMEDINPFTHFGAPIQYNQEGGNKE